MLHALTGAPRCSFPCAPPPLQDLICNWVGNKQWLDALPWAGAARWAAAADEAWVVRGKQAGTVRTVGPLSFVRVFEAGHMVRRCTVWVFLAGWLARLAT